jgi:hypothetical protein
MPEGNQRIFWLLECPNPTPQQGEIFAVRLVRLNFYRVVTDETTGASKVKLSTGGKLSRPSCITGSADCRVNHTY